MTEATPREVALEEVACPSCGSSRSVPEARGPDYDVHCCGSQQFTMVSCSGCGTLYLNPRPVTRELPVIYPPTDYYSYSLSERGNSVVLKARLKRDRVKAGQVLGLLGREPGQAVVADIGAGDGALLEAFASLGVARERLIGVELDANAVASLDRRGFGVAHVRAEELELSQDSVDAFTMIQVIEHVADPLALMRRLHGLLRPGGLLLLETPNIAAWDRRFFRRELWGGYHFPRHWTLWSPAGMRESLRRCGFEVVHFSTPPAAVLWAWSVNHLVQSRLGNGMAARFFGLGNPAVLGAFWFLELIPSMLGRSANMRFIARKAQA